MMAKLVGYATQSPNENIPQMVNTFIFKLILVSTSEKDISSIIRPKIAISLHRFVWDDAIGR